MSETLAKKKAKQGWSWHSYFGHMAAPKKGEKGYKGAKSLPEGAYDGVAPRDLAASLFDAVQSLWDDPEFAPSWRQWSEAPAEVHDPEGLLSRGELADMVGVPLRDGRGNEMDEDQRWRFAQAVVALVAETMPENWQGKEFGRSISNRELTRLRKKGKTPQAKQLFTSARVVRDSGGNVPPWLGQAILQDALNPGASKRLVLITKEEAADFIARHHSQLPKLNPRGLIYTLGVCYGDRLVAVATAGTPTGRWNPAKLKERGIDLHNVLELTRVASDATHRGASSMLVSRLLDLLEDTKRGDTDAKSLFVTYQLSAEEGSTYTSLKDKGLRPVARVEGKRNGTGARKGSKDALATEDKIRWEAGSSPLPADWSLLNKKQEGDSAMSLQKEHEKMLRLLIKEDLHAVVKHLAPTTAQTRTLDGRSKERARYAGHIGEGKRWPDEWAFHDMLDKMYQSTCKEVLALIKNWPESESLATLEGAKKALKASNIDSGDVAGLLVKLGYGVQKVVDDKVRDIIKGDDVQKIKQAYNLLIASFDNKARHGKSIPDSEIKLAAMADCAVDAKEGRSAGFLIKMEPDNEMFGFRTTGRWVEFQNLLIIPGSEHNGYFYKPNRYEDPEVGLIEMLDGVRENIARGEDLIRKPNPARTASAKQKVEEYMDMINLITLPDLRTVQYQIRIKLAKIRLCNWTREQIETSRAEKKKPLFKSGDCIRQADGKIYQIWTVGEFDDYSQARKYKLMDPADRQMRWSNNPGYGGLYEKVTKKETKKVSTQEGADSSYKSMIRGEVTNYSGPLGSANFDDMPWELAVSAYKGTSHFPERAAGTVIQDYINTVAGLARELEKYKTDQSAESMKSAVQEFKEEYVKAIKPMLLTKSRTLSTMIAGGSGFNVKRAQKANDADRSATEKFLNRIKSLRSNIIARFKPVKPSIESNDPAVLKQYLATLEKRQAYYKDINKIARSRRKADKDPEARVKRLVDELGLDEKFARDLMFPDWGKPGIAQSSMTSINGKIKRVKEKIERIEGLGKEPVRIEFDGGEIVENRRLDRVQVFYDDRVSREEFNARKSKAASLGFRWSGREEAFQTNLSTRAIEKARELVEWEFGSIKGGAK